MFPTSGRGGLANKQKAEIQGSSRPRGAGARPPRRGRGRRASYDVQVSCGSETQAKGFIRDIIPVKRVPGRFHFGRIRHFSIFFGKILKLKFDEVGLFGRLWLRAPAPAVHRDPKDRPGAFPARRPKWWSADAGRNPPWRRTPRSLPTPRLPSSTVFRGVLCM